MEGQSISVSLELIKDYEFRVRFSDRLPELLMDEPPSLGGGLGPNAAQVLSAAVGNCLSASLLFCLRKARTAPKGLKSVVTTTLTRNERGRIRIGASHVLLTVELAPEGRERMNRCFELFEDHCTVTQSVRQGIAVEVEVQDQHGETLYRSGKVSEGMLEPASSLHS